MDKCKIVFRCKMCGEHVCERPDGMFSTATFPYFQSGRVHICDESTGQRGILELIGCKGYYGDGVNHTAGEEK